MENEDNWKHSFERVIPDQTPVSFGLFVFFIGLMRSPQW